MATYFGITVEDVFNSMHSRFRPEGAKGPRQTFGYDIRDAGQWKLTLAAGQMQLEKTGDLSGCDATMTTDAETFAGLTLGRIDALPQGAAETVPSASVPPTPGTTGWPGR